MDTKEFRRKIGPRYDEIVKAVKELKADKKLSPDDVVEFLKSKYPEVIPQALFIVFVG